MRQRDFPMATIYGQIMTFSALEAQTKRRRQKLKEKKEPEREGEGVSHLTQLHLFGLEEDEIFRGDAPSRWSSATDVDSLSGQLNITGIFLKWYYGTIMTTKCR